MRQDPDNCANNVTGDHRRQWRRCLYVYPVISRRAKGLSIGINLNPDKRCNFSCVYCQINRNITRGLHEVDIEVVRAELREAMQAAIDGELWSEERFAKTPADLRRINDIALSGDGEPTCLINFDAAVRVAADVKSEFAPDDVKLVVISNASQFDSPQFQRALETLDAHNGEIWAKLDAGTETYFHQVNRPDPVIPLDRIVQNIISVASARAIVIQTLLLRLNGNAPPDAEIDAYCAQLLRIRDSGGKLKLIQLHTIARAPQEPTAAALSNTELDAIASRVRNTVRDVPIETYYGVNPTASESNVGS